MNCLDFRIGMCRTVILVDQCMPATVLNMSGCDKPSSGYSLSVLLLEHYLRDGEETRKWECLYIKLGQLGLSKHSWLWEASIG